MNPLAAYPLAQALGWTLVHFCWQGAAIALLLWCVLGALGARLSRARYAACCAALALMVALPLVTFVRLAIEDYRLAALARTRIPVADIFINAGGPAALPWTAKLSAALDLSMPWLLAAWCTGVACLFARLGLGLLAARALRRSGAAVSAHLQSIFDDLLHRLDISRTVQLLESARVDVPTVIGWLRPAVLLPASCLTGLAPEQLEALLCHELAHIRRHDYLISILQSVVETLLFYHPAVWWVSRQVRRERECCCDDFAVRAGGNPLAYARALALLEEQRSVTPQFALAANGGILKMRIQRLLGRPQGSTASQFASIAVLIVLAASALGMAARMAWAEARNSRTTLATVSTQMLQASDPSASTTAPASDRISHPPAAPSAQQALPTSKSSSRSPLDDAHLLHEQLEGVRGQLEKNETSYAALMTQQHNAKQLSEDGLRRLQDARQAMEKSQRQYNDLLAKLEQAEIKAQTQSAQTAMARVNTPEFQKQLADAKAAIASLNSEELHREVERAKQGASRVNSPELRKQLQEAASAAQKIQQMAGKELYALNAAPAATETPAPDEQPAQSNPSGAQRVSAGVMQGMVISQPPPVYPPEAKAAHVQGVVVLHAVISKEGKVEQLNVISGPPMLVKSAIDAVQQWTYHPYMLNGQPVEVETTINVNYTFGGDDSTRVRQPDGLGASTASAASETLWRVPDPPIADQAGETVRKIGGGVSVPTVVRQVTPEYSEEARKAKFSGAVLVGLVVNSQGNPLNVHVIRGVGMGLDEKAVEAVRQYRFRPAMENGKPVPVALNVEVNFQIFDGPKPPAETSP